MTATAALNPLAQANQAVQQQNAGKDQKIQAAARQFESVLLTQLLQVLWKSTPEMSQGQGGMYQSMFQDSFADQLAAGGGIGLADMIAKGLGAESKEGGGLTGTRHVQNLKLPNVGSEGLTMPSLQALASRSGAAAGGDGNVMTDVSAAAHSLLKDGGKQWGKAGALNAEDLGTVNATAAAGDSARRTIDGANGYRGYYKCNLFAFELARRAGLQVPQLEGSGAMNIPGSNQLTQDAGDGSLDTGWAKVATGASPAAMQDVLRAGEAAFLVVGSGQDGRHGHMAVVEHPRSIDYDEQGKIRSISFEGWEAQPDGAKHLGSRTWNRVGETGSKGDRNGLERIEIIQLSRKPGEPVDTTQPTIKTPLQTR